MKALRAIILLIVYTAFTAGAVLAKHSCGEVCDIASTSHTAYAESGVPPTECAEKEAVNNQPLEHRSGAAVKLVMQTMPVAGNRASCNFNQRHVSSGTIKAHSQQLYSLPIYIDNCVFRL